MRYVSLAPISAADGPELVRANAASRAYHQPWITPAADPDAFADWFESLQDGRSAALIARAELSGGIVGVLSFSQIFLGNFCSAYLGFYGVAAFAGSGLMTAALCQTAAYGFSELGLHRIEANIQPDNARSIALVRRAGFRREGFSPAYLKIGRAWRDHERWALLESDLPAGSTKPVAPT